MPDHPTTRLLDAAANRAAEGLRVVEDYVRFVLDDAYLTELLKQTRHACADCCKMLLATDRLPARETQQDVGTEIATESESERVDVWDVCAASLERTKQSLRSLEEFSKVDAPEIAAQFEALRYRLYTIEKAIGVTRSSRLRLSDVRLCVLLDGASTAAKFTKLVEQLLDEGVGMIQLREKNLGDRELIERARLLTTHRQPHTTLTIINDRPDIAAATNADGVHLGQDDLSVKDARGILGPRKLIGVSTHNIAQARQAVLDGANYLGAGPTFPSATKQFDEFPGLEYLREVAAEISLPTFAIGGIDAENLSQVQEAGITRVAVSGAIGHSANPRETAREMLEILRQHTS